MLDNQKNIIVDKYNIYGNIIHVQSYNKQLLKFIYKYWKPFYNKKSLLKPKIIFYFIKYNTINKIRKGQYLCNDNFLLILESDRFITCNLYETPWQVYIQYSNESDISFLYFYQFEPIFFNILKRLNLFHLHGSAVTKDGNGIIIPGGPEDGKTTTALSFLRAGFKILSDDQVFLQKRDSGIYALGFDDGIFITNKTISFFPELKIFKEVPLYKKGRQFKKRIEIKKLFPNSIAQKTKISLIIFPKIVANQKTRLEPISKSQALIKMLNQKPKEYKSLIKDGIALTKQFNLYSSLAQSIKAYNLFMGEKIGDIPKLVSELLKC